MHFFSLSLSLSLTLSLSLSNLRLNGLASPVVVIDGQMLVKNGREKKEDIGEIVRERKIGLVR